MNEEKICFCLLLVLCCFHLAHLQGPCGDRLCLEYASGLVHQDNDEINTFIQTAQYDFIIEWSFTPESPAEKLAEIVLKHDDDVLASGDATHFKVVLSNIRSVSGRYTAQFTDQKNYVFSLQNLNKKYASGLYTITAYYKHGNLKDEQFVNLKFNFGLKVNGGYTPWSPFTKCKQCGLGRVTRLRTCENPKPDFGGLDCKHLGPSVDRFPCKFKDCRTGDVHPLQTTQLRSSIEQGLSIMNMLEFGYHCFITPSLNTNEKNRYFLSSEDRGSRDLLKEIYALTEKSHKVFLHCSKFPCANNGCRGAIFMTKEVLKGNVNLFDIRLSVDFEK